jgi:hypothetical protein
VVSGGKQTKTIIFIEKWKRGIHLDGLFEKLDIEVVRHSEKELCNYAEIKKMLLLMCRCLSSLV